MRMEIFFYISSNRTHDRQEQRKKILKQIPQGLPNEHNLRSGRSIKLNKWCAAFNFY